MKRSFIFSLILFPQLLWASDFDYSAFVKRCGWGTLMGTGLGVISLAFEDHPYDHLTNVAKGASLGLYAGMIYGVTVPSEQPRTRIDIGPLEDEGDSTQFLFNMDWLQKKSEVLWVYRF